MVSPKVDGNVSVRRRVSYPEIMADIYEKEASDLRKKLANTARLNDPKRHRRWKRLEHLEELIALLADPGGHA